MEGLTVGLALAFWLGLLTAISPCPLTTNIAAMSFIGKRLGSTRHVLLSGLLYTLGRIVAYTVLGIVVVFGLVSTPGLSTFLQNYANRLLGPILILIGMFLLELLSFDFSLSAGGEGLKKRVEGGGLVWAAILGFVFALSFCPPSAALFFGSVIPLSIKYGSNVAVPVVYGIGTGLPVLVFAVAIAKGAKAMASTFERVRRFEFWARRITGALFVLAGIYLSLVYVYRFV